MSFPRPILTIEMKNHVNWLSFEIVEGENDISFRPIGRGEIKINGRYPVGTYTRDSWERVKHAIKEWRGEE